jgi:saccharopine dehydrogenase-like NADP-dependent oxidoreductase
MDAHKHIVVFGAGKSATGLIDYLLRRCAVQGWDLTVVDAQAEVARAKVAGSPGARGLGMNILTEAENRLALVREADAVISLMPPALHELIAADCLSADKHLLTASYVDESLRAMAPAIRDRGLLFLCEMGLDPGIDHMSAMSLLDGIRKKGGDIRGFRSHCGGLVAPASDDNPWHYKISWNPRNVVLAGKAGARFREAGVDRQTVYEDLFDPERRVNIPGLGMLAWYPNRDSLGYASLYGLERVPTFIRTTLRHPDFCAGWKRIVGLKLTDETPVYDTDDMSLAEFFRAHVQRFGLVAEPDGQLRYLGWNAGDLINRGRCSAADVLQFALETRLALKPADQDMVVMLHEVLYELEGIPHMLNSSLVVEGTDSIHTAMARTVGLPLGIAAVLLLEGKLSLTGLHIPTLPEIYAPVLQQLATEGIVFTDAEQPSW